MKDFRHIVFFLAVISCSSYAFSQVKERVTHINGDSLVGCVAVNVSSWGIVDNNPNGCPETGPADAEYGRSF